MCKFAKIFIPNQKHEGRGHYAWLKRENNMQKLIEIVGGVARHPRYRMKEPVNLEILAGEQIAIVGRNVGANIVAPDF